METLDILRSPLVDNSLKQYSFFHVPAVNPHSIDNNDQINFSIQRLESYTLPHDSYLQIEGQVVDGTTGNALDASVKLTSNFAAFLFADIKYDLNGVTVDSTKNVGITTCMKGSASLTKDQVVALRAASWGEPLVDSNGYFSVTVPLRFLMGFFEDYKHILINMRQELSLIRSKNDQNCFISTNDKTAKIKLSGISWKVPFLTPADDQKLKILQILNKNVPISIAFRSWELFRVSVGMRNT